MTYLSSSVNPDVARRAEALRRAQAGDRAALNELVAELTPLLWNVVRRQGVDPVSAEDVVQLTWLKFWSGMQNITTPDAVVGWLVVVAKREAIRVWKSGCREEPVEPEWDSFADEGPDMDERVADEVTRTAINRLLWTVVAQLDERCQGLIRVIAFSERPDYNDVAESLGMPRGSIGPTRGRCLTKLRKLLSANPAWTERVELS